MPPFKLYFKTVDLTLKQPFTISRGTKKTVSNVFIELTDGTHTGYGEAAPNTRYHEDADKVIRYLETIPSNFFSDIETGEQFVSKIEDHNQSVKSVKSAQAAIETAWLDWWGKSQNKPLWELWEAPSPTGPVTSYTIGLDTVEVMQQKAEQESEYPTYKVKLGTERDREIINGLREVTDKPIRVDANEGWTTLDQAKEMISFLAGQNIELIEQPMPAARKDDLTTLKAFSPLPLCADESFIGFESLAEIAKSFDIINIKLMKTGSLIKAKKIMDEAHQHNLQVMIGCMIESSVANTAGGLLSLWADYADLDGHLLIKDDPASGLSLTENMNIQLSKKPGLGLQMK